MKIGTMALIAAAGLAGVANAAPSLTALSSFGTNGWVAPGTSTFLGTGNLERGLAYNRATGNLVLISRNGGVNARIINGTTGADTGSLSGLASVTGGTFAANKVGITDDGQIFVANLVADARASAVKIYRWGSETDAGPTNWFNSTLTLPAGGTAPRLGDSMDVTGTGSNARVVLGHNGTVGYSLFTGGAGGATAQSVTAFSPTLGASKYRLGVTFGASSNEIYGKVTSDSLYRSTFNGTSTANYDFNAGTLSGAGESAMDFVTIAGVNYLAVMDMNSSVVRIYDMTNPATPLQLTVGIFGGGSTTTTGTLTGNGNASGDVKWGNVNNLTQTATLYAMSTNQGIQAFTFTVPAPGTAALMGLAGIVASRRRR